MSEQRRNKHSDWLVFVITIAVSGTIFASTFFVYPTSIPKDEAVTALAEEGGKEFKWTKQAVDEGTTVDADYLWPDEVNPSFTAVYRDGKQLSDEKMVTITAGSVYHFRGRSDDAVLYTEVYIGAPAALDITSGETGTWYRLLPSSIRKDFEDSGWAWEMGQESIERAYLDSESKRIVIKNNDHTAVLYGVGLYLDNQYEYTDTEIFSQNVDNFKTVFGNTDNIFASALEYYYTKGGELRSKCPEIYEAVNDTVSQSELIQSRESTSASKTGLSLMTDLVDYVNTERSKAGLSDIAWDDANDDNITTRVKEISSLFSQTRPDGSDAFTAYTDSVMCEVRLENVGDVEDVFKCAESYFYKEDVKSFSCASYGDKAILIFIW